MSEFLSLDSSPLHPLNDNTSRFSKREIEGGNSFIVVLAASSFSKPCMLPKPSSKFSSFEQPNRIRVWRDFNLQMLCGRIARLLHSLRFNRTSPFRCWIDEGSSFIAVPSKKSSNKLPLFSKTSGSPLSFKQSERIRISRDLNL